MTTANRSPLSLSFPKPFTTIWICYGTRSKPKKVPQELREYFMTGHEPDINSLNLDAKILGKETM